MDEGSPFLDFCLLGLWKAPVYIQGLPTALPVLDPCLCAIYRLIAISAISFSLLPYHLR